LSSGKYWLLTLLNISMTVSVTSSYRNAIYMPPGNG
jgi:hypothetical protein